MKPQVNKFTYAYILVCCSIVSIILVLTRVDLLPPAPKAGNWEGLQASLKND